MQIDYANALCEENLDPVFTLQNIPPAPCFSNSLIGSQSQPLHRESNKGLFNAMTATENGEGLPATAGETHWRRTSTDYMTPPADGEDAAELEVDVSATQQQMSVSQEEATFPSVDLDFDIDDRDLTQGLESSDFVSQSFLRTDADSRASQHNNPCDGFHMATGKHSRRPLSVALDAERMSDEDGKKLQKMTAMMRQSINYK